MGAPGAIADDPVIDRIASEVALVSHYVERRRGASANSEAAQCPEIGLGWKSVAGRVLGYDIENRRKPFPPGFELSSRPESVCGKIV
jgi:hypothetical protein